jgi:hypothetical protein
MAVGQAFQPDNWAVRLESLTFVFGRFHLTDQAFMPWKGQAVKVQVIVPQTLAARHPPRHWYLDIAA